MLLYIARSNFTQPDISGVKRKILAQTAVFRKYFDKVYHTTFCGGMAYLMEGEKIIDKDLAITREDIKEVLCKWLKKYGVKQTYIRYSFINSNRWFLHLLELQKEKGIRTIVEFHTFPYDMEIRNPRVKEEDAFYREYFRNYFELAIGTDTMNPDNKSILGIPCLPLRNGVDIGENPLHKGSREPGKIVLICVSGMAPWHGYERVLEGLHEYYKSGGKYCFLLKMVGDGVERKRYEALTKQYQLQEYVKFYGRLEGEALDREYDTADIGISILGSYKRKMYGSASLKTGEYCARGIPFIDAGKDLRFFGNEDYVMSVPNTAAPLDMHEVAGFYENICTKQDLSQKMRKFAEEHLAWEPLMMPVIRYLQGYDVETCLKMADTMPGGSAN